MKEDDTSMSMLECADLWREMMAKGIIDPNLDKPFAWFAKRIFDYRDQKLREKKDECAKTASNPPSNNGA